MARIQRKKSTSRAKAKSANGRSAPGSENGSAPAKSTPAVAAPRQTEKTPVNYPGKQYVDTAVQFLREVRVELRKVTWPSRKQTIGSTVVVIVLVLMISMFLGVVDVGLSSLVNVVLQ